MNNYFILTGATGNLGLNVISTINADEHRIRALVQKNDNYAEYLPNNIEIVYGDILDIEALNKLFDLPENCNVYVIHMAAIVTTEFEYNKLVYDVNVVGTKNIVDVCVEKQVNKLIYISSSSAIKELPNNELIVENNNYSPNDVLGFYAKTKAEASAYVVEACKNRGLNASIVQPTALLGPSDYSIGYLTKLIMDICNNKLTMGIEGGFDIADVRDVAQGIINCVFWGKQGESYLFSGSYISVKDIFKLAMKCIGKNTNHHIVPIWFAKAIMPLANLYSKITKQKELVTIYSLYNLYRNNNYSNLKSKKELNFTTRSLEETVMDTINWLKKFGKIK